MTLILIDTSAWARIGQRTIAQKIADAIEANAVAIVAPITLELLRSARNAKELAELGEAYDALHQIQVTEAIIDRCRDVQAALALRGYHRGPSPIDLVAAAAAEAVGAEVWHCDRHFELIASWTRQAVTRLR